MERKGRVLIVDDESRWRETPAKVLQRGGFDVATFENIHDALDAIVSDIFHVLVLDIRMQDFDESNTEGMQMLEKLSNLHVGVGREMQVIMLSAHGTKEQMRKAFAQHQVADFVSKDDFDSLQFLQQVQQLFQDEIQINLKLEIHWQDVVPEQLMVDRRIEGKYIKKGDVEVQQKLALELEDLLCRLFYKARSIAIKPLISGKSGAGVMWVEPFYEAGAGQPVVVKFGDVTDIFEEYRRFADYVVPFIGGGRTTTAQLPRRTLHLAGIVYTFVGRDNERLQSFADFYNLADHQMLRNLVENLFGETCAKWYASPGTLTLVDLTDAYMKSLRFTFDMLDRAIDDKKFRTGVKCSPALSFRALNNPREFMNPVSAARNIRLQRPTYVCNTHGDLNEGNILIDEMGHTWLIDFLRSGPGHILRDVAELDITVRLRVLEPEAATLTERLAMEETLCTIERFSQLDGLETAFPTDNRALAKAYAATVKLRQKARELVRHNSNDDMSEYYIALFYYSLNLVRFFDIPIIQREHALLSASLLAERIGLKRTS